MNFRLWLRDFEDIRKILEEAERRLSLCKGYHPSIEMIKRIRDNFLRDENVAVRGLVFLLQRKTDDEVVNKLNGKLRHMIEGMKKYRLVFDEYIERSRKKV